MARSKAPRKRKPTPSSRPSRPDFPKRFLISLPPESAHDDPAEFFYDTPQDAIRHCVHLGPQFFLDTHFDRHSSASSAALSRLTHPTAMSFSSPCPPTRSLSPPKPVSCPFPSTRGINTPTTGPMSSTMALLRYAEIPHVYPAPGKAAVHH